MSQEQGFFRQAIYCLNRVLFTNRNDLGAQWDRIVLFATIGEHRKVASIAPNPNPSPNPKLCLNLTLSLIHSPLSMPYMTFTANVYAPETCLAAFADTAASAWFPANAS